jgi:hypothetical protein
MISPLRSACLYSQSIVMLTAAIGNAIRTSTAPAAALPDTYIAMPAMNSDKEAIKSI